MRRVLEEDVPRAAAELRSLVQEERRGRFAVVVSPNASSDVPLQWLRSYRGETRAYWACPRSRTGETIAGVGAAKVVAGPGGAEEAVFDGEGRYIGGGRFDAGTDVAPEWQRFGGHAFVLPLLCLERDAEGRLLMACHLKDDSQMSELDKLLDVRSTEVAPLRNGGTHRIEETIPRDDEWRNLVEAFRENDQLEKVVLARRRTFVGRDAQDPWDLLATLEDQPGARDFCYRYGLQLNEDVFLGCSPELLCAVDDNGLTCDVLAGTRRRDPQDDEDCKLAAELVTSSKETLENDIVRVFVEKRLAMIADGVEATDVDVVKLTNVQHLRREVTAQLRPGTSLSSVLSSLHPTPATLGTPPEIARTFLRRENFDRGWYAGPFGAVSSSGATFAVALRSALYRPSTVLAYAGAGIVPGSDPVDEANEVDFKLLPIQNVLLHGPSCSEEEPSSSSSSEEEE